MSSKAKNGLWKVKNRIDHSVLKNKWMIKIIIPVRAVLFCQPFCQIKYKATAIKIKSVVQTGANMKFGGLNSGLFKPAYHVGMAGVVKIDPMPPAPRQSASAPQSFAQLTLRKKFFLLVIKLLLNNKHLNCPAFHLGCQK